MNILIIHEIDWEEKVIFEPHHLAELFSIQGHEIFVIDCAQPNSKDLIKGMQTRILLNYSRVYDNANITLIRPASFLVKGVNRMIHYFSCKKVIQKTIQDRKIDKIFLYGSITNGIQTIKIAQEKKIPVIYRVLDISHEKDSKQSTIEVKASTGDTHLGGDDFDQKIIHWILDEFKKDQGIDLSKDKTALQRLKESAEKAKIELSTAQETEINQPFITTDDSGPKHLVLKMTRAKLEEIVGELVEKTLIPCEEAIKDAGFKKEDIDEIILVGGMTRMPYVQKKVEEFFGKKPNVSVNPDEVVAMGAAIQAGQFEGSIGGKEVLLLDVTPLTLGIETLGGVRTALIDKNTTIPASKSQIFSTAADNQTSVEIHILQGEREMSQDNKSLGRFILSGIPPSPRGVPQVEVSFDIDANGILNVKAVDKATGTEQKITITASSGLSKEEVEKMKQEAEKHAESDKKKREEVETMNNAESIIFNTEKLLKDSEDKEKYPNGISEETKKKVTDKLEELKKAKESKVIEDIKKKLEEINTVVQEVGQELYKQAEANKKADPKAEEAKTEDKKEEPVEAEFEDAKKEEEPKTEEPKAEEKKEETK